MTHTSNTTHTNHTKKHIQKLPISIYLILGACLIANTVVIVMMFSYFI